MNKHAHQTKSQKRQGWRRFFGILILFTVLAVFAFPKEWNTAMRQMNEKVKFHLPYAPETEFNLGLDLKGGAHLVYDADMSAIPEASRAEALQGVRDVVERRVNAFGVSEATIQTVASADSTYRVVVDMPGVTNVVDAVKQIGATPILEFKIPKVDISYEPTAADQAKVDSDQATQRAAALAVWDRAKAGEDFGALAKEFSIDTATKDNNGYIGFVTKDDPEYGGLVEKLEKEKTRTGLVKGLYEGTSRLHIINYLLRQENKNPVASHILICWQGKDNCSSTRTQEEAKTLIDEIKGKANRRNFADLAEQYSEDPGSKDKGGSLGTVTKGQMVEPFETALFALRDKVISEVVETQFGYHLIYRSASVPSYAYEISHIEFPWTTLSDVVVVDPWENVELSGKNIESTSVAFDPNTGAPYVVLNFNSEGAELFGKLTAAQTGNVIGIFLDGYPITTPVVQEAIYGGQASITGDFTVEEAKTLSQRLNAGALPVPITLASQQTIGPSLGTESLDLSIKAGLVGFALVALFMLAYYRLAGLFAIIALAFYALLNLVIYKALGVTMTLSGIAGFIFSLGIAVDANVLVFERLKEELRDGRDLATAAEESFRRAWTSIRDGNLTTLIATAVLYSMSTGFIRGFALTLTVGVLTSMLSAMIINRAMLRLVVRRKFLAKKIFFLGL